MTGQCRGCLSPGPCLHTMASAQKNLERIPGPARSLPAVCSLLLCNLELQHCPPTLWWPSLSPHPAPGEAPGRGENRRLPVQLCFRGPASPWLPGNVGGMSWPQVSKAGNCSTAPAVGGDTSGQCCCAFKDQHVMWGQRSSASHCVGSLHLNHPHPLLPLAQAGPFVTLGFYSVYFISYGNTCRETWYPNVPPVLVFTKNRGRTPNGGPWGSLSHFVSLQAYLLRS